LTVSPIFAYAQARIQARYGALPTEEDWQRLAGARTLGLFLEEAREGALRDWVKGFSASSDAHDLDRGLRVIWTESVDQVTQWMPKPWRGSVAWLRWLPLLPILAHAAGGGPLPEWADRDPILRTWRGADGTLDPAALSAAGAGALLVPPPELAQAWRAQWRRLWPACGRRLASSLQHLEAMAARHMAAFRSAGGDAAWPLRRELRERLRLDFHRRPLEPTVAFIFLALVVLDLERLRAAIMQRALFSSQEPV